MSVLGNSIIAKNSLSKANSTSVADEYSSSSVYSVGELVIYKANLYKCTTAITTAEVWNPAHWTLTTVEAEIDQSENDIEDLYNKKADKEVLSFIDRRIKYIYEKQEGQYFDIEEDTNPAYSKTVPIGGLSVDTESIGGNSVVQNQLIDTTKDISETGENYSVNVVNASSAEIDSIGGKSVVVNQLVPSKEPYSRTLLGVTLIDTMKSLEISGESDASSGYINFSRGDFLTKIEKNHVYSLLVNYSQKVSDYIFSSIGFYTSSGGVPSLWFEGIDSEKTVKYTRESGIATTVFYRIDYRFNGTVSCKINLVDMTQWFGVTETSQVTDAMKAEVEAYIAAHPNFVGFEIVSADCEEAVSRGKNLIDDSTLVYESDNKAKLFGYFYPGGNEGDETEINGGSLGTVHIQNINLKRGKTYTLYGNFGIGNSSSEYMNIACRIKGTTTYKSIGNINVTDTKTRRFTADNDYDKMLFVRYANGQYFTVEKNSLQLEEGSTVTPYSPYGTLGTLEIPSALRTDHPLRSAGTAYDEYRLNTMIHHGETDIVDLGSLDYSAWSVAVFVSSGIVDLVKKPSSNNVRANILSSNFENNAWTDVITTGYYGISIGVDGRIGIRTVQEYSSASDFKAAMDGVYLIYEKETPTDTDISSYFPADFNPQLPVESGGTLTFKQTDTELPVPSTITWAKTAWTQPLDSTHKYLVSDNGTDSIVTGISSYNVVGAEDYIIDLTKFFGGNTTILNAITTPQDAHSYGVPRTREPYNEGELVSADVTGVVSEGKNLCNPDDTIINKSIDETGTIGNSSSYSIYIAKVAKGKRYCVNKYSGVYAFFIDKPVSGSVSYNGQRMTSPIDANVPFVSPIDGYVGIRISNSAESDIQIEESEVTTPYATYVGTLGTLSIPDALREAHPLHSAGNVYDEYNFERKYTIKRIGELLLNGTQAITTKTGLSYIYSYSDDSIANTTDQTLCYTLSDKIVSNSQINIARSEFGIGQFSWGNQIAFRIQGITTSADAKEWLRLNNTLVYYILSTPIYYYDPTSPELAVNGGTIVPDATHIVDPESYFPATVDTILSTEPGGSVTFEQTDTELRIPNDQTWLINVPDVASA